MNGVFGLCLMYGCMDGWMDGCSLTVRGCILYGLRGRAIHGLRGKAIHTWICQQCAADTRIVCGLHVVVCICTALRKQGSDLK